MKAIRRNFRKDRPIYLACESKDSYRTELKFVYFHGGNAYATNSRIAVRIPLSELILDEGHYGEDLAQEICTSLNGYAILGSVLKKIYSYTYISVDAEAHAICVQDDGMEIKFVARPFTTKKEGWKNGCVMMPDIEPLLSKRTDERQPVDRIGLRASELSTLTAAMGCSTNVKLEFNTERGTIFVLPNNSLYNAIGIMAPLLV